MTEMNYIGISLKESESKNIDSILKYFNLELDEVLQRPRDFNRKFTPERLCRFCLITYLDMYTSLSPKNIGDYLNIRSLGSIRIKQAKKTIMGSKTIQHLFFEVLKLEYK